MSRFLCVFTELYIFEAIAIHLFGNSDRLIIFEHGQRRLQGSLQFRFLLRMCDCMSILTYDTSTAAL